MSKKYLFLLLLLPLPFLPELASLFGKPFFTRKWEEKTGAQVAITSLSFSWLGPQKFKQLQFKKDSFTAAIEEISIQAPFWSFSGPFDLRGVVQPTDPQLGAILGPSIDVSGTVHDSLLHLQISSPTLQTELYGRLTSDTLTLEQPLLLTLQPAPSLLMGIEPKSPVTLRIEPQGFSFPLPYSLSKLQVGQVTLDLGQVQCKNGASLATLISFLKDSRLSKEKKVNGWFTPVTFSIKEGKLHFGRIDLLLADTIHLCAWGKVNLINEKLDLYLGLPADTLERSFGLRNLPKNYVLKIEVGGTIQEPHLVTGPAAAKIAALIAANQVPKEGILGGIAELIKSPKEDKEVPPPTRPFPWEK